MATDTKDIKIGDKGSMGYLPLIIPLALGIVVLAGAEEILLPIAAIAGLGWAWKRYQKQQQKKLAHLNAVFYRLVQENQGRVTVLDLAMKANLPGTEVQKYLHEKAVEFSAHFEVTEQGGLLYYFESAFSMMGLSTLDSGSKALNLDILSSKNGTHSSSRSQASSFQFPLTQVEIAKRLKVHPATVSKWKNKVEFPEWSRDKDPEKIAWEYDPDTKRFAPHWSDRYKT